MFVPAEFQPRRILSRIASLLRRRLRLGFGGRNDGIERGILRVSLAELTGRERGEAGERIAGVWLEKRGCRIAERNYRCRVGELDLIAHRRNLVVFAEVKTRSSARFGRPAEAVGSRTRARMCAAASQYLLRFGSRDRECRFDVIEVLAIGRGRVEVTHIKDAFRPGWV
jgi:putative endonuclease